MMTEHRKTRDATPGDWVCPMHKLTVELKVRKTLHDDGRETKGVYYGCPKYHECRYYVSGDMRVPVEVK